MNRPDKNRNVERGQVLPLLVLSFIPIFAFVSLAVDVGIWRNDQRIAQAAADSAAIAAAQELNYGDYAAAAQADADSNLTANGIGSPTVTVTTPASSDSTYSGIANTVEVYVYIKPPTFFSQFFGVKPQIKAKAVAEMQTEDGGDCMYILKSFQLDASQSHFIDAPSCDIIDDGTWTQTTGTVSSPSIGVAGTISLTGNTNFPQATPAPALAVADPCMQMSGCAYLVNNPPSTSGCQAAVTENDGPATLVPGCYAGFTDDGQTVTFEPGVYTFTGNFTMNGGTVNGDGVTFNMEGSAATVYNGGTENLTAPTSGDTAGILIYQPSSNTSTLEMHGGDVSGVCPVTDTPTNSGAVYAPGAEVEVLGSEWTPSTIIAGSLVQNGGTVCVTLQPGTTTFPVEHSVLVE
ncbi:MAG TPA: pilus assembly protein TadG-related protein [Candidatus Acidoferrales bacterium]|nr:pilus assembly protein TadG-related protein [Candidatus Acidoferrales bacterium]